MIKDKQLIIRLLNALFAGVKIYLFGSRPCKTHQLTSDIDIAFDAGHKIDILKIQQARNVLDTLYVPQKIDIVDLNSIPTELREIILKEGIL